MTGKLEILPKIEFLQDAACVLKYFVPIYFPQISIVNSSSRTFGRDCGFWYQMYTTVDKSTIIVRKNCTYYCYSMVFGLTTSNATKYHSSPEPFDQIMLTADSDTALLASKCRRSTMFLKVHNDDEGDCYFNC